MIIASSNGINRQITKAPYVDPLNCLKRMRKKTPETKPRWQGEASFTGQSWLRTEIDRNQYNLRYKIAQRGKQACAELFC